MQNSKSLHENTKLDLGGIINPFGVNKKENDKKAKEIKVDFGTIQNPFASNASSSLGSSLFSGGTSGAQVYAPQGSEIHEFLTKRRGGNVSSTSTVKETKERDSTKFQGDVNEVEMNGVHFEMIFVDEYSE